MAGIFSGMDLYLLQTYFKEDDSMGAMILLVAIGSIIIISVVVGLVRHGVGGAAGGKGGSAAPRRFNGFTLHRIAATYGLDRDQSKLLEFVFRSDSVSDPERVMQNPQALDRHFKRAYQIIERSAEGEEQVQQRMVRLFSLRNAIEAAPVESGPTSTKQLSGNTSAIINTGKASYPVKVISSKGDSITVEAPRTTLGAQVSLPQGSQVSITFFAKSSKGFSFETRVLGTVNTNQGPGLQLAHSGKPKTQAQRRYRRKQINTGCEFHLVNVENVKEGRKKVSKLIVDTRRFTGTAVDISTGGCSIKTSSPAPVGSRLKIDIAYSGSSMITVLGQVLRTNRSGAAGTILHIKFLKIPRRAFNNINALVFGYNEN